MEELTYKETMKLFIVRYAIRTGNLQDNCMFDTRDVKGKKDRPLFLRPDIQIVFEHFIMGFCSAGGKIT